MRKLLLGALLGFSITACQSEPKQEKIPAEQVAKNELIGTWELVSNTIHRGDSVIDEDLTGSRMIKIINETHFAFLNHDLKKGEDSTLVKFVAGGGSYILNGNKYQENLEYCNFRTWENHDFEFEIQFKGDTLVQSGIEKSDELGVAQKIIETYVRTK